MLDTLIYLKRARDIALRAGLHYVYTGNVHNVEGDTTFCPSCKTPLIVRDWYEIRDYHLTDDGHCPQCHTRIAGHFGHFELKRQFGAQRIPVAMHLV